MKTIQVLGMGCRSCAALKANVETAVRTLGIEADVQRIEDIEEIAKFGVWSTPALAVDGKIQFAGRIASAKEIMELLSK